MVKHFLDQHMQLEAEVVLLMKKTPDQPVEEPDKQGRGGNYLYFTTMALLICRPGVVKYDPL